MLTTSTEEFPDGLFRAHGKISMSIFQDNILIYKAQGPFNIELLEAVKAVEKDILHHLNITTDAWCEMVIFEHSCIALDDVIAELPLYLKQVKASGICSQAAAFVIPPEVEGLSLMKSKYEQCYHSVDIPFSIFSNKDDALQWLKQYLTKP